MLERELTRVEKSIAGQAVGHLDATAVGAVEGLSLGGAAVSVAREESFKGGEVGGTAAGRGRSQAREQRAQQDGERSHLVVKSREVCYIIVELQLQFNNNNDPIELFFFLPQKFHGRHRHADMSLTDDGQSIPIRAISFQSDTAPMTFSGNEYENYKEVCYQTNFRIHGTWRAMLMPRISISFFSLTLRFWCYSSSTN